MELRQSVCPGTTPTNQIDLGVFPLAVETGRATLSWRVSAECHNTITFYSKLVNHLVPFSWKLSFLLKLAFSTSIA